MLFCSTEFLLFFVVVFVLYWAMPWQRPRVWLLLLASFYFYSCWSKWLASLICLTTLMDYIIARGMDSSSNRGWRKLLLTVSIIGNLGMLCWFKYANFFMRSLEEALHAAGASTSLPVLRVILPIGISFYTFEAINYTVDVYLGKVRAERSLANFMLFILFFPHLVAGPIVRARDFLPQVSRHKRWSWPRLHLGMQFIILGLFKKLAIADRMAQFADPVFTDAASFNSGALWLGALAYALQLYCDFSGYSDMALGFAHMLGYKLAINFNMPYLSANISEFWRRWHISLSTWLRDYLFIPLGGSRGSSWRTTLNLLITMTLGGLWHGANWPFIAFGFLQGCWLGLHRWFRGFCEANPGFNRLLQSRPGTAARIAGTFTLFCLTLVVFRSPSLVAGWTMLGRMFVPSVGQGSPLHNRSLWVTVAIVILAHYLGREQRWRGLMAKLPAPVRGFGYATVLTLALLLAPEANKAFIYFQF